MQRNISARGSPTVDVVHVFAAPRITSPTQSSLGGEQDGARRRESRRILAAYVPNAADHPSTKGKATSHA